MQLRQTGEAATLLFTAVRTVSPVSLETRLLPSTQDVVTVLIQLLISATEETERMDEFDEDFLREQQVKLLQIRASRAVLSSQHILRLMLTSPVPMSIGHSATSGPAPTSPSRTPHTDKSDVDADSDVVDGSANESALVNQLVLGKFELEF